MESIFLNLRNLILDVIRELFLMRSVFFQVARKKNGSHFPLSRILFVSPNFLSSSGDFLCHPFLFGCNVVLLASLATHCCTYICSYFLFLSYSTTLKIKFELFIMIYLICTYYVSML